MSFLFDRRHRSNGEPPPPLPAAPPQPPIRAVPLPDAAYGRPPPCPGVYQPPGSCDRPRLKLDPTLERVIRRHFRDHFTPSHKAKQPPPVLFLLGPTGIGKTVTAETYASRKGIGLLKIAGADLGGNEPWLEGAAVHTLNLALAWIAWNSARNHTPTCLLIDDIDASILPERPGITGTNSTDLLRGKLQTIADRPDAPCQIWTGNSSADLKPALLRAGRCRLHRYAPELAAKALLVEHLFQPATERHRRLVLKIARKYRHRPIAWFSQLRLALADQAIEEQLDRLDLDFDALEAEPDPADQLDLDALYAAAARADADHGGDFSH
jgi:hypothetical protein